MRKACARCNKAERAPMGAYCKPCAAERYQEWRARDLDGLRAQQNGYRKVWYDKHVRPITAERKQARATARASGMANGPEADVWCSCKRYEADITACLHGGRRVSKNSVEQREWQEAKSRLLLEQRYRCAICGTNKPRRKAGVYWHLDHDHVTGELRGVLCADCNLALGMMRDNPANLERAAAYLRRPERGPVLAVPHRRRRRAEPCQLALEGAVIGQVLEITTPERPPRGRGTAGEGASKPIESIQMRGDG